ncbi:MAG: hypothetical protein OEY34_04995 [Cyclobacteriaceae bacterium]|nr:hypothetical protein [Cyclobacteriaceae bacterium]
MASVLEIMPELEGKELSYIQGIFNSLDESKIKLFTNVYRERRKKPQDILLFSVLGLLVVPGLQRFLLNQIGMGLLFLFTLGLCFIGSILDLINHKDLTYEYNKRIADELILSL